MMVCIKFNKLEEKYVYMIFIEKSWEKDSISC